MVSSEEKKRIIVIVGPSGSGKTSISFQLAKAGFPKLVTTTTRQPRTGERDGVDYYFRDMKFFECEAFVEQTEYNGRRYGLTQAEVREKLERHDTVQLAMDQNGVRAMQAAFPEETFVVFVTISKKTMAERMRARGDDEQTIAERIEHSTQNEEYIPPQNADLMLENNNLDECVQKIIEALGEDN